MDLLKYSGIISSPLVAILVLVLITNMPGYSVFRNTLSQSILFIKSNHKLLLFRFIFIIKGILDLTFSAYLIYKSNIDIFSITGIILLIYPVIFTVGGFITEADSSELHNKIIYFSGLLWLVGNLLLSIQMHDKLLIFGLLIVFIIVLLISYIYNKRKKLNYIAQSFCMTIIWLWILLLTIRL
jgi:hypothetical protein